MLALLIEIFGDKRSVALSYRMCIKKISLSKRRFSPTTIELKQIVQTTQKHKCWALKLTGWSAIVVIYILMPKKFLKGPLPFWMY